MYLKGNVSDLTCRSVSVGIKSPLNIPSGRSSYSLTALPQCNAMLMFRGGGIVGTSTLISSGYLCDLWRWNSTSTQWTLLKSSTLTFNSPAVYGSIGVAIMSNTPAATLSHGATFALDSDLLYIFGGITAVQKINEMWQLNYLSNMWTYIASGPSAGTYNRSQTQYPGAREDVTLVAIPNTSLVAMVGSFF